MATRSSARTSRSQASSPPKPSTPVARRTRTRSASVELDNNRPKTKRGKRSSRQTSVESVDSNTSIVSSNQGRRNKVPKEIAYPELSSVAEDAENEEGDDEEGENKQKPDVIQQSPGGYSQMSGTTAITSASAQSSYSNSEVEGLDLNMILEVLPGLWSSSRALLLLVAPINSSTESVDKLVRELKVPGSKLAMILRHRERKFDDDKVNFVGSDNFIRASFIIQKLFKCPVEQVEPGAPRPEPILQAANLATLVKDLLVLPKEAFATYNFFSNLDTWFPESFVTQFDDNILNGHSTMLEESLEIALDIRTQYTIVALLHHKSSQQEWDPDAVLAELFFEPLMKRNPRMSSYDDTVKNGQVKNLMRTGPENTDEHDDIIKDRVAAIRAAFRQSEDAAQAGDLVDFDILEESFPWLTFLAAIVKWARARVEEVEESIRVQGGVESLVQSLVEAIRGNDSQIDLVIEPNTTNTPRQLLPAANIIPSNTGHSYLGLKSVRALEKMKQDISASYPGSKVVREPENPKSNVSAVSKESQRRAATSINADASLLTRNPARSRSEFNSRATAPLEASHQLPKSTNEFFDYPMDDEEDGAHETNPESVDLKVLSLWDNYERTVSNVENTPPAARHRHVEERLPIPKLNFPSSGNERNERNEAGPSKRKGRPVEHGSDDSVSQDEGFEADRRSPNAASLARQVSAQQSRPTKRVRVAEPAVEVIDQAEEDDQEDEEERAPTAAQALRLPSQPRDNGRRAVSEDLFVEDEDADHAPRPSATQISTIARAESAKARRGVGETQSRTPWSENDSEHLIDLIADMGCRWSEIEKAANFEHERGQVALKDKARNMKVDFLMSRVPLPLNFDKVKLGKKEIAKVRRVRPHYEP